MPQVCTIASVRSTSHPELSSDISFVRPAFPSVLLFSLFYLFFMKRLRRFETLLCITLFQVRHFR